MIPADELREFQEWKARKALAAYRRALFVRMVPAFGAGFVTASALAWAVTR